MTPQHAWEIPPEFQPDPSALSYDLNHALGSVVSLRTRIPADAYTAEVLGTERFGQAVAISAEGVLLTIGYLTTEAEEVWLTTYDGRALQAHPLAYDQTTGFGLVQALGPLNLPALPLGNSHALALGEHVVIGGAGGRSRSLAARVVARQEFAGYWEYLLDEAIFTAPAHPHWGGAAVIGPTGDLVGIGSLQLQHPADGGAVVPLNMSVPIDLLKPILDDLLTHGRVSRPARAWLGLYAGEDQAGRVILLGLAGDGPARRAGLRAGDIVLAVAGTGVMSLSSFYRRLWALGDAGVEVPLTLSREGDIFDVRVTSAARERFLRSPRLH